jgi:diguanylate cyclase (GGDEF)-like protein/PAS domain S-box-containing protein
MRLSTRILLVDDSTADAQILGGMLAFAHDPPCEFTRVGQLREALELLVTERFDVILLDLGLPDVRGLEGVRTLRAVATGAAIVVLTEAGSEAVAVDALEAGAEDHLVKGRLDEDTLRRSIRFAIVRREADLAQHLLTAIVESSEDAIITTDLDTTITSWNSAAERLYGYPRDEAVGRPVAMIVPPERRGEERDVLARVLTAGRLDQFETTRVCADGTVKDISLNVAPIRDGNGAVIAFSAIAHDITESARAAQSLRAAEERFRVAFDEAPIGMALVGLDRRFIRVNAALAALVGYDAADLEGRDATSIDHPEDPVINLHAVRSFLEDQTSYLGSDRRLLRADGHSVWVTLNITCVRGPDGEPQHYLAQMQDITARRGYETQLQHMADHDPLTGLLNRRAFERELRSHVARGERYGVTGAALMIDLDNFKSYNDARGHQAGDVLIARVGDALAKRLRRSDVLARIGGDEFAVLLPNAGKAGTRRLVEGLLDCVRNTGAVDAAGITASIGVAFFDDEPGLQPEEVIGNADRGMYEAKQAGRDRASFHSPDGVGAAGP